MIQVIVQLLMEIPATILCKDCTLPMTMLL